VIVALTFLRPILALVVTAKEYVWPRLSRMKRRRRFRGAYHHCLCALPGIRPCQPKVLTHFRLKRRVTHLWYTQFLSRGPSRRHSYGRRPNKQSRQELRHDRTASILCSLQWREVHYPFGLYYSKDTVDSFFRSVDPLSHFHLLSDFISHMSPTVTDGIVFPHRQTILFASLNYNYNSPIEYGSFETRSDTTTNKSGSPEFPIVLDTGASWTVTPHIGDFVSPIKPSGFNKLSSLDSSIQVRGIGTVEWRVEDMHGTVRVLRT
jgi:hypothetical protein